MYAHILIATDGSDLAQRAVEQGLALAKALNAKVTAVTVTEPWTAAVSGEWAVAFPVEEYENSEPSGFVQGHEIPMAKILATVLSEKSEDALPRLFKGFVPVFILDGFEGRGVDDENTQTPAL